MGNRLTSCVLVAYVIDNLEMMNLIPATIHKLIGNHGIFEPLRRVLFPMFLLSCDYSACCNVLGIGGCVVNPTLWSKYVVSFAYVKAICSIGCCYMNS